MRGRIEDGSWPVGTKVPGEHELVKAFGASRNTVREALRGLVHLGLLESRPGDGTYVRSTSELEAILGRRAAGSEKCVTEIFEVREALEVQGARLAAERATEEQIDELEKLLDLRRDAQDVDERLHADVRFHQAFVAASANPLITELHRGLKPSVLNDRKNYHRLDDPMFLGEEHRAIVEALKQRDPEAAALAVKRLSEKAHQESASQA